VREPEIGRRWAPISSRCSRPMTWTYGELMARKKSSMSEDHKAALAEGRKQGKAVREYLEALDAQRPKRGRPRTIESIEARLEAIDAALAEAVPTRRLELVQERLNLTTELEGLRNAGSMDDLEASFVELAAAYGDRKGISYQAWREVGVPAAVLKRAGISRSATS
jgi:hypothetical protein